MEQIETKNHILTLIEEQMRDIPEDAGLLAVFYWEVRPQDFKETYIELIKDTIRNVLSENAKVLVIPREEHPTELKLYSFASKEES